MLKPKNLNIMRYQDLINLDFKRTDYHDDVEFRESGQHPYWLQFDLTKRIILQYDSGTDHVKLLRMDKDENIVGTIRLTEIADIKEVIKFYKP